MKQLGGGEPDTLARWLDSEDPVRLDVHFPDLERWLNQRDRSEEILTALTGLAGQLQEIQNTMATQNQLDALEAALGTEHQAVSDEITRVNASIQKLTDALAAAGVTDPAVDAAVAQVTADTASLTAVAVNATPPPTPLPVPNPAPASGP